MISRYVKTAYMLAQGIVGVLFVFILWCDFVVLAGLIIHFAKGGAHGVGAWILHIGTEGRIEVSASAPGTVSLTFPSTSQIYKEFLFACVILIAFTTGTWLLLKLLRRKLSNLPSG